MIQSFAAVDQCTIWDICLNTYGSVDFIVKLMLDNDFPNINTYPVAGQLFLYDDTLVVNQNIKQTGLPALKYATRERTTTNDAIMKYYEQTLEHQYVSVNDGETLIVIPALIGSRVVQIEKETKPVDDANFLFNPSAGLIALLNGVTVDKGQTLYIIYAVIKTS